METWVLMVKRVMRGDIKRISWKGSWIELLAKLRKHPSEIKEFAQRKVDFIIFWTWGVQNNPHICLVAVLAERPLNKERVPNLPEISTGHALVKNNYTQNVELTKIIKQYHLIDLCVLLVLVQVHTLLPRCKLLSGPGKKHSLMCFCGYRDWNRTLIIM